MPALVLLANMAGSARQLWLQTCTDPFKVVRKFRPNLFHKIDPQVYIRGQEEEHHYDEHDYEFCGKSVPGEVKTPGPRLVLLFNAGSKPGSGFKARYAFETGEHGLFAG
jgi:hypothetical protein